MSTTERRSGGVTPWGSRTRADRPSSAPSTQRTRGGQPTVRRRRAVRKAAPEPEPEPEPAPAPAEEEEFSDFHSKSQATVGAPRAAICAGYHTKLAGNWRIGSPSAWM